MFKETKKVLSHNNSHISLHFQYCKFNLNLVNNYKAVSSVGAWPTICLDLNLAPNHLEKLDLDI